MARKDNRRYMFYRHGSSPPRLIRLRVTPRRDADYARQTSFCRHAVLLVSGKVIPRYSSSIRYTVISFRYRCQHENFIAATGEMAQTFTHFRMRAAAERYVSSLIRMAACRERAFTAEMPSREVFFSDKDYFQPCPEIDRRRANIPVIFPGDFAAY